MANYGAAGEILLEAGKRDLNEKANLTGLPQRKLSLPALIATVVVPWFIFVVTFYARAMSIRYFFPWLSFLIAIWFLLCVLVIGVMACSAIMNNQEGTRRPLGLVFLLSVVAWVSGWVLGDTIYKRFTENYQDIQNLNDYPNVDPLTFTGNRLMDAGVIEFSTKAELDLTKAIGFKDDDVYCVTPISVADAPSDTKTFDFWAVGTNCCSSHPDENYPDRQSKFECGEYNVAGVHKGLRVMDDDARTFYRLAVKEAEAAYNIEANHPIFVHWMGDPEYEVEAFQDDAFRYFMLGVFGSFGVLVFVALAAGIILNLTF